jgi:hypothetical protein
MGAAASFETKIDEAAARTLAGEAFDDAVWGLVRDGYGETSLGDFVTGLQKESARRAALSEELSAVKAEQLQRENEVKESVAVEAKKYKHVMKQLREEGVTKARMAFERTLEAKARVKEEHERLEALRKELKEAKASQARSEAAVSALANDRERLSSELVPLLAKVAEARAWREADAVATQALEASLEAAAQRLAAADATATANATNLAATVEAQQKVMHAEHAAVIDALQREHGLALKAAEAGDFSPADAAGNDTDPLEWIVSTALAQEAYARDPDLGGTTTQLDEREAQLQASETAASEHAQEAHARAEAAEAAAAAREAKLTRQLQAAEADNALLAEQLKVAGQRPLASSEDAMPTRRRDKAVGKVEERGQSKEEEDEGIKAEAKLTEQPNFAAPIRQEVASPDGCVLVVLELAEEKISATRLELSRPASPAKAAAAASSGSVAVAASGSLVLAEAESKEDIIEKALGSGRGRSRPEPRTLKTTNDDGSGLAYSSSSVASSASAAASKGRCKRQLATTAATAVSETTKPARGGGRRVVRQLTPQTSTASPVELATTAPAPVSFLHAALLLDGALPPDDDESIFSDDNVSMYFDGSGSLDGSLDNVYLPETLPEGARVVTAPTQPRRSIKKASRSHPNKARHRDYSVLVDASSSMRTADRAGYAKRNTRWDQAREAL